jgi:hypothetical protein
MNALTCILVLLGNRRLIGISLCLIGLAAALPARAADSPFPDI